LENVEILRNPVLRDCLGKLRDINTERKEFREHLRKAGRYMAYELAKHLPYETVNVSTPLGTAESVKLRDDRVIVVGVLRAAVPMVYGILETLENVRLGLVSAKRIEDEHADRNNYNMEVEVKYKGMPSDGEYLVLVDPMLATGSTLCKILKEIDSRKYKKVYLLSVISTELGIWRVLETEPRARILTLAIDPELNSRAYIVPGLGDAGDRAFG